MDSMAGSKDILKTILAMRVVFRVDKNTVLKEVGRSTAYFSSRKKEKEDEGAYEKMSTTDSDKDLLEQYWKAACSAATEQLVHFARSIENNVEGDTPYYEVVMEMASQYDTNLNKSVEDSLQNFFINLITSKWMNVVSTEDAQVFAADAIGYMKDVENKMYFRKRPERTTNKREEEDELLPSIYVERSDS